MDSVQTIIKKMRRGQVTTEELLHYLDSDLLLIKANAILSIVRLNRPDNEIIGKLVHIAKEIYTDSPVVGNITNSKLAIAALKWLDTNASISAYDKMVRNFDMHLIEEIEWLVNNKPNY